MYDILCRYKMLKALTPHIKIMCLIFLVLYFLNSFDNAGFKWHVVFGIFQSRNYMDFDANICQNTK